MVNYDPKSYDPNQQFRSEPYRTESYPRDLNDNYNDNQHTVRS